MDDDSLELAKAIAEGSASGLVGPAFDAARAFAATIFGDTGEAVDGYFADRINARRLYRRIEVLGRAKQLCDNWGVEPEEVGLKVSRPLLEAAGDEGDAALRERWATLLANAAGESHGRPSVRPGFVDVLRQLEPDDVALVDWLYDRTNDPIVPMIDSRGLLVVDSLDPIQRQLGLRRELFDVVVENVIRLGLAERPLESGRPRYDIGSDVMSSREKLARTSFGLAFVRACSGSAE